MQIYSLVKIPEKVTADRYKENGVAEKEIEVRCIEEYFWVANGTLVKYTGNQVDVRIPEDVKAIGNWIFVDCLNVESVFIPHSVKRMGQYAFTNCKALSRILYEGTEEEWQRVTEGRQGSIREHVEILCQDTDRMNLADIDLFDIEDGVLVRCNNVGDGNVIIPPGVTKINACAFLGYRSLKSIIMPPSVTQIGNDAFFGCSSLNSIKISSNVTQIGHGAFGECGSLVSIEIPPSVIQIGDSAFRKCSRLVSIGIPLSVTQIGYGAFAKCNNLTDIYYGGSKIEWKKLDVDTPRSTKIHYDYRR